MNFSAFEYWTDGYMEHSLMPTDGGLRACHCGAFYLMRDATKLEIDAGPDVAWTLGVHPADLPKAINTASSPDLETTARRNYWRDLNNGYRLLYRAHRQKENALDDSQWRQDYIDSLSRFKRLLHKLKPSDPKSDFPKKSRPFTVPPFRPTTEQTENMKALLALILDGAEAPLKPDNLEIAELHRELGQFEAAAAALNSADDRDQRVTKKVIATLIDERSAAPVRYRP